MFILREFQKRATVTLAFSNVRGSHSSVVWNSNHVKCLMVNRESDLIIQTTAWFQYGKHHRKSHHEATVNCESLLWLLRRGIKSAEFQEKSCLPCPCCSNRFSLQSPPHWEPELKEKNLFWNKLENKNIDTKPESFPEHYWGKAIFNIAESHLYVRS